MFRNRRFACAVLSVWLGAGVCVDLLINQNISTTGPRFLADQVSARAATEIGLNG